MTWAFRRRPLAENPKTAAHVAEMHGVTVEHLLDTIRKRRAYRTAKMYRKRSRTRHVENRRGEGFLGQVKKRARADANYAGEGELHALMRAAGIDKTQFCALVGMHRSTFEKWNSHPLHDWPVRFMRLFAWTMNARNWMDKHGIDAEQFNVVLDGKVNKAGRYPRKAADVAIAEKK